MTADEFFADEEWVESLRIKINMIVSKHISSDHRNDLDDLCSAVFLRLINKTIQSYNPKKGRDFLGFILSRVKFAMLDELREWDPASRMQRDRLKTINRVNQDLFQKLGREPTEEEIFKSSGLSAKKFDPRMRWCPVLCSLDDLLDPDHDNDTEFVEVLADEHMSTPFVECARNEQMVLVKKAVAYADLTDQERSYIHSYFWDDRKLDDIAKQDRLTLSRASQVVMKAKRKLRKALVKQMDADAVLGIAA